MTDPHAKVVKKPGVSSLWRTAMLCMLAGMVLHWWVATKAPPREQGLTIRGDPLPAEECYDLRLDHVLDAVDIDRVPLPDALKLIAKQAGLQVVLTPEILNPAGVAEPDPPPLVTLHLKKVKVGDALSAVFGTQDQQIDARANWTEANGILYPTAERYHSRKLFTRIYDVKRLLDMHDRVSGPTTQSYVDIGSERFFDGRASWLEAILVQQTAVGWNRYYAKGGESYMSLYSDSLIITATAEQHRTIEHILRKLDRE